MSRGWKWKSGDWYVSCDVCSKQIYASDSLRRWDGMIVCKEDFETRHPQELIKHRTDNQSVPFTRPEATEIFNEYYGFIDFWTVKDNVDFVWTYNRDFTELITSSDEVVFDFGKSLKDDITVADGLVLQSSALLGLTDTVTTSSSGDIFAFDYVDSTYVGIDYVGSVAGTIT